MLVHPDVRNVMLQSILQCVIMLTCLNAVNNNSFNTGCWLSSNGVHTASTLKFSHSMPTIRRQRRPGGTVSCRGALGTTRRDIIFILTPWSYKNNIEKNWLLPNTQHWNTKFFEFFYIFSLIFVTLMGSMYYWTVKSSSVVNSPWNDLRGVLSILSGYKRSL